MAQEGATARRFGHRLPAVPRLRLWLAVAASAVAVALVLLGVLGQLFAVPVVGLLLALGAPPDYVFEAKSVARSRRNTVLGVVLAVAAAIVVLQPQLNL